LIVARFAAERKQLDIVCDEIGAPTSTQAIADAVTKLVRSDLPSSRVAVNVSCSGETSRSGFAEAIVDSLRKRNPGVGQSASYRSRVRIILRGPRVHAISRLGSPKAREIFSIGMPTWQEALDAELAALAELRGITITLPVPAVVNRLERSPTEG